MASKVTNEDILRINELYYKHKTYAEVARQTGFAASTVKKYIGHGIGHALHESPDVPNYGTAGRGVRLCNGMTLAIEPMINMGTAKVIMLPDGWTVKTADRSLSAHYENSIAITESDPIILTEIGLD